MQKDRNAWDETICPSCGVIKSPKSVGKYHSCNKCGYEGVYTLRMILSGKTEYPEWNDVNLKLFLESLQFLGLLFYDK